MKSVNKCFNEVKKDCFKFISSQETKRDKFKNTVIIFSVFVSITLVGFIAG